MSKVKFKVHVKNLLKWIVFALFIVDVNFPVTESETTIQAGINGKHIQKGWRFLKGCMKSGDDVSRYADDYVKNSRLQMNSKFITLPLNSELANLFDETVNCVDDILPQINENLSKPISEKTSSPKIIRCLKQDVGQTRMALYENNTLKLNKIIKSSNEVINLNEYNIYQMEEFSYIGNDGLEWVVFRIPRKAEYILNGKFEGRVFECMVFNLPKDSSGKWEQLRAFLIDLFTRPGQLWDEYLFYSELKKLNLNKHEVNELHEYTFALLNNIYYDYIKKSVSEKTIA